jgi:hypothetical protein
MIKLVCYSNITYYFINGIIRIGGTPSFANGKKIFLKTINGYERNKFNINNAKGNKTIKKTKCNSL